MKQIVLLTFLLNFLSDLFGQNIIQHEFTAPYPIKVETISFTVLDINFNKQLVAFKHVFKLPTIYDETGEVYQQPCNCHYVGMEKQPFAGVVLGVYDLKTQKYLKVFTIYQAAYDTSECMNYNKSKENLAEVKEYFKTHDLDITQKPTPLYFSTDKENSLIIDGIKFSAISERLDDSQEFLYATMSKLYANGDLIYIIEQEDHFEMASGGEIRYIAAYRNKNKVVFLNLFHHTNNMAGDADADIYHFSPIFDLTEF